MANLRDESEGEDICKNPRNHKYSDYGCTRQPVIFWQYASDNDGSLNS